MNALKCEICGGNLIIQPGSDIVTCQFCGVSYPKQALIDLYKKNTSNKTHEDNKQDLQAKIQKADHSFKNRVYDEAYDEYLSILELDPNDLLSFVLKAVAYSGKLNSISALSDFANSIESAIDKIVTSNHVEEVKNYCLSTLLCESCIAAEKMTMKKIKETNGMVNLDSEIAKLSLAIIRCYDLIPTHSMFNFPKSNSDKYDYNLSLVRTVASIWDSSTRSTTLNKLNMSVVKPLCYFDNTILILKLINILSEDDKISGNNNNNLDMVEQDLIISEYDQMHIKYSELIDREKVVSKNIKEIDESYQKESKRLFRKNGNLVERLRKDLNNASEELDQIHKEQESTKDQIKKLDGKLQKIAWSKWGDNEKFPQTKEDMNKLIRKIQIQTAEKNGLIIEQI